MANKYSFKHKHILLLISFISCSTFFAKGQVVNTATLDTTDIESNGKFKINGFIDTYYAWNDNEPNEKDIPYFNSSQRHNEFSINLAYIDFNYSSSKIRARFIPSFGSFMNANYATETGTLKDLLEARVGIKLSEKKEIWIDAGVLGSPFTNENAVSKDQLMYTRSLAAEFVPYYLSGVRLSVPISNKTNFYAYVINGWQQIVDLNHDKSLAIQFESRPNNNWLLNWNVYAGNHQTIYYPNHRMRYFSDVYAIYAPAKSKLNMSACLYAGMQEIKDSITGVLKNVFWSQANITARYFVAKNWSISGRLEAFIDNDEAEVISITNEKGFNTFSHTLGLNYHVNKNAMFRIEQRSIYADKYIFEATKNRITNTSNYIVGSLAVWF